MNHRSSSLPIVVPFHSVTMTKARVKSLKHAQGTLTDQILWFQMPLSLFAFYISLAACRELISVHDV